VVEHTFQRLRKEAEIVSGEPSLIGQVRRDESMANVETIRNDFLAAHSPIAAFLFLGFLRVVTAMRVMDCCNETIGSTERENVS